MTVPVEHYIPKLNTSNDKISKYHTSAGTRHLQDMLGLFCNCLISIRHSQDIYKTSSCRWLAIDISKIS